MTEFPSLTLTATLTITYSDGSFLRHSLEVKELLKIESAICDLQAVARILCKAGEK